MILFWLYNNFSPSNNYIQIKKQIHTLIKHKLQLKDNSWENTPRYIKLQFFFSIFLAFFFPMKLKSNIFNTFILISRKLKKKKPHLGCFNNILQLLMANGVHLKVTFILHFFPLYSHDQYERSLTLRCVSMVPPRVPTIIVHLIVPLHPQHSLYLLTTQPSTP